MSGLLAPRFVLSLIPSSRFLASSSSRASSSHRFSPSNVHHAHASHAHRNTQSLLTSSSNSLSYLASTTNTRRQSQCVNQTTSSAPASAPAARSTSSILSSIPSSLSSLSRTSTTTSSTTPSVPAFSFPCEKTALTRLYEANSGPHREHAFFVNDLGVVERQYQRWCTNLPNVKPYYAVKCSPDPVLIKTLFAAGTNFDCASGEEIGLCLAAGASPSQIIFANPIKNYRDLKYAHSVGVRKMTFDNVDELHKIKAHHPNAQVVLRLLPDDSGSLMRFGVKFGAPIQNIPDILSTCKALNIELIGCSFHIGSGCFNPNKYNEAIKLASNVFDMAEKAGLPKLTLLDLGGGFPGNPVPNARTPAEGGLMTPAFEEFATVIRSSLAELFPASRGVEVIAEPGRYMATAWSTLFTLVQGKRVEPQEPNKTGPKKILYYINDGVYGSFNCLMFDHAHPVPVPAHRFMDDKIAVEDEKITFASPQRQLPVNNVNINLNAAAPAPLSSLSQSSTMSLSPSYMPASSTSSDSASVSASAYARSASSSSSSSSSDMCLGTFFGPTCDSMDVIASDLLIEELHVGDWLAFSEFGAYTSASSTTFNGMERPIHHYVRSNRPSPSKSDSSNKQ